MSGAPDARHHVRLFSLFDGPHCRINTLTIRTAPMVIQHGSYLVIRSASVSTSLFYCNEVFAADILQPARDCASQVQRRPIFAYFFYNRVIDTGGSHV
jgi:hypothetical protein